jgi:hypothetical protein
VCRPIWLSPVLKNARPDWEHNYHGYGIQDFVSIDERFASDGTRATAESELTELIDQAHARGLHIILDMVINHAARVFDYVYEGRAVSSFRDPKIMDAPPGGIGNGQKGFSSTLFFANAVYRHGRHCSTFRQPRPYGSSSLGAIQFQLSRHKSPL